MKYDHNLTAKTVENLKEPGRYFDGGGLYIEVTTRGTKLWRMKYRLDGKEKLASFGVWPRVSLKEARQRAEETREKIKAGIDPIQEKRALKAAAKAEEQRLARTFEIVGREWHATMTLNNSPISRAQKLQRLENYIFPSIGNIPITELEPKDILQTIKPVEQRGKLEQAHRLLRLVAQVCRYARAADYVKYNAAADLSGALAPTPKATPRAALLDPAEVGHLLRAIDSYGGYAPMKYALKLLPYLFVRSLEIRGARWAEIDFKRGLWTITASRMKVKAAHTVPLSRQAAALLLEIKQWTGQGDLVFPSAQGRGKMITG